ncbi:hypothetical protein SE17_01265 [Kouleothrix aurantiaca]|uniref:Uncharacterized protein n=1 Tax=Kouleothrix aurantiaca TaxID=186479 RepID=A0A0N8PT87_9CHLR|nr:hypothetical protein SE17_01265 [Kouleothrix aurantiaca]
MPQPEDIHNQFHLLAAHRRTLVHYLKQEAMVGSAHTTPEISHGIYEARQAIRRIKLTLRAWQMTVEDLPDDEALVEPLLMPFVNQSSVPIYRFRAECEQDVDTLRTILGTRVMKIIKLNEAPFPDTIVEVHGNVSLAELQDAMRKIEDGHVMLQTVAQRENYTGERNYDLR